MYAEFLAIKAIYDECQRGSDNKVYKAITHEQRLAMLLIAGPNWSRLGSMRLRPHTPKLGHGSRPTPTSNLPEIWAMRCVVLAP